MSGYSQPHAPVLAPAPSVSLGTAAVNKNSYHDLRLPDPSASSSKSQYHYPPPKQEYFNKRHSASSTSSSRPHPSSSIANHPYLQHTGMPNADHANTSDHTNTNHLYAPAPTRVLGKFTEEWDASQRGSSIIDSPLPKHYSQRNHKPSNMSSIQRSNSLSGSVKSGRGVDTDAASAISVSRSNTLKKKSSLRRNGSLGRSGSRRSTKAGSVRSLVLQSNADEDEVHSAFYCPVPTTGNPTEALANRFQCA